MVDALWKKLYEGKQPWQNKIPAITTHADRIINEINKKEEEKADLEMQCDQILKEFGEDYTYGVRDKLRTLERIISDKTKEIDKVRIFDQFFKELIDKFNLGFFVNGGENVVDETWNSSDRSILNSPTTSVFAFPYSTQERTDINCCFGVSPYLAINCKFYLYSMEPRFEMKFVYFFPKIGVQTILYFTNIHGGAFEHKKFSPDSSLKLTEFERAHYMYYQDKLFDTVEDFVIKNKLNVAHEL